MISINYIIKRFIQILITSLIIVTIVFIAVRLSPGDPAGVMMGMKGDRYTYQHLKTFMGLDRPWIVQYSEYLKGILTGNLGMSIFYSRPVIEMIFSRITATLQLAFLAILITVLIGVPLGIYCFLNSQTRLGKLLALLAYSTQAMAEFWLGIILILIFSIKLGVLPSFGKGTLAYIILPAFSISLPLLARVLRFIRTGLFEIMGSDYIRTARSKGVSERAILYKHALKNIMIPFITDIGVRFGGLLGGMVVVEAVFKWPGMGSLMIQAVQSRDYPLIEGCILIFAFLFLVVNVLIDISYVFIDPRIRYTS